MASNPPSSGSMTCPKCHTGNDPTAKLYRSCGAAFASEPVRPAPQVRTTTKALLGCLLALIGVPLLQSDAEAAQNGYKDFRWGTTQANLAGRVPDLKADFAGEYSLTGNAMNKVYIYQHPAAMLKKKLTSSASLTRWVTLLDEIDKLERSLSQKLTTYSSEALSADFSFLQDRLVAVHVHFTAPVGDDLQRKYGHRKTLTTTSRIEGILIFCVWDSPTRIMFWEMNVAGESLFYIDPKVYALEWVQPLTRIFSAQTANSKKEKEKLD